MERSPTVQLLTQLATLEAQGCRNGQLEPEHLFIAACKLADLGELIKALPTVQQDVIWIRQVLRKVGADGASVRRRLRSMMRKLGSTQPEFTGGRSPRCEEVFKAAEDLAREQGHEWITFRQMITVLTIEGSVLIRRAIAEVEGHWTLLREAMGLEEGGRESIAKTLDASRRDATFRADPKQPQAKEGKKSTTPLLDRFARDLTALAKAGHLAICIGRRAEMRQVARILRRQTKNNPVLVGDPGVGKTCIVEGLAQRAAAEDAPETIRDWRIFEVNVATLLAGTMLRGQFEARLKQLIDEASADRNVVLFIDELHTLVGAGANPNEGMDAGQILKPALARGQMRVIGATTTAEYRKYIESDGALERRFQMVWVNEPTREEAVEILQGLKPGLEQHHGVAIHEEAIVKSVEFAMRYLPDRRLPDKAIDLLDEACSARMVVTLSPHTLRSASDQPPVDVADVASIIADRCGIPMGALTTEEHTRLRGLEKALAMRVMGQDHALREVAEAVRTARVGLGDPRRPAGVFLLLGPTGTGKTELAKALAEFLFGSEDAMIRFDMSEYKERHSLNKLIGAPPGYIGHEEEGQLIGKVRSRPYSVVLFDEVEKAHPEVFDLFLQIFDDGRLTDAKGRRAVFTDSIIILTSNLGSRLAVRSSSPVGGIGIDVEASRRINGNRPPHHVSGVDASKPNASGVDKSTGLGDKLPSQYLQAIQTEVERFFRPELLNRIQRQIVFRPLTRTVIAAIVGKLVNRLNQRLEEKQIVVDLSPRAQEKLIEEGYDEVYGARKLERVFEQHITDRLAAEILSGRVRQGQRVRVDVRHGGYGFEQA